jgi:K+-transporting ATPase c subunit
LKVPIFLFTLIYNIGVCSMGALNLIFHNSAAGLFVKKQQKTYISYLIKNHNS